MGIVCQSYANMAVQRECFRNYMELTCKLCVNHMGMTWELNISDVGIIWD